MDFSAGIGKGTRLLTVQIYVNWGKEMSFHVPQPVTIPSKFMGMSGPFYIPEAHLKFPKSMTCSLSLSQYALPSIHILARHNGLLS